MKIPVFWKAVDSYDLEALQQAEAALMEGEALAIEVEREEEGEQQMHILAAIWIRKRIK